MSSLSPKTMVSRTLKGNRKSGKGHTPHWKAIDVFQLVCNRKHNVFELSRLPQERESFSFQVHVYFERRQNKRGMLRGHRMVVPSEKWSILGLNLLIDLVGEHGEGVP